MRRGWVIGQNPAVRVDRPVDWTLKPDSNRSWFYHLHALDLIDPLLEEYARSGDTGPLAMARDIFLDWGRAAEAGEAPPEALWYDMAVGLRAWRLAWLDAACLAEGLLDADQTRRFTSLAREHAARLLDEANFTRRTNHGFFQAAGMLALAGSRLAPDADAAAIARRRLTDMLDLHFTADGVHKEHSPDYHFHVARGYRLLADLGLLTAPDARKRIEKAEAALAWFVKPDGRLVNFGDSDNRPLDAASAPASAPSGLKTFAQGGYAVVRAKTASGPAFLAQTQCFHSRTHKQADDLSLVWFDRGHDILIDAGRFGYGDKTEAGSALRQAGFNYSDPRRIFCESVRAHNTIEIDGADHDRMRPPYGSALLDAGESLGVFHVIAQVRHGPVLHTRLTLFEPGRWLCVLDGLQARDWRARTYRQWHHLAPEWRLMADGAGFSAVRGDGSDLRLGVIPLTPGMGGEGPWLGAGDPDGGPGSDHAALQGWWSPGSNRFEPAPAFAFTAREARGAVMATLFALGGEGRGQVRMNRALIGTAVLDIGRRRVHVARTRKGVAVGIGSADL